MKPFYKSIFKVAFLFLILSSLVSPANAAIPHLINYQGKLTDSTAKPVSNGTHSVTFRIFDVQSGGSPLWEETQSVTTQKGIFNVLLGGVTALSLAFDKPYWLEIKVESEVLTPRQQITSSGYAIRAEKAEDATTVANTGVSTTPTPNKLLPLDASAKIPLAALGLKVYDSGWFSFSQGTATITHNLGTEKCLIQILGSASTDGSGTHYLLAAYNDVRPAGDVDMLKVTLSPSQITFSTYSAGVEIRDPSTGNEILIQGLRVIMLALE